MPTEYGEMNLGHESEQMLLQRILINSGFEYSGSRIMRGLSGLDHHIDAVGVRGDNLALVLSGPKDLGLRPEKETSTPSPKFKSEIWCRDALLRMYDISSVLEREGIKVDLVLFENRLTQDLPTIKGFFEIEPWIQENNLPTDWSSFWQTSISNIDLPGTRYLSETGQSAGACYFGLNDLALHEIAAICGKDEGLAAEKTRSAMSRVRIDQYFNPPTDELILTALALSSRHDPAIIEDVYRAAISLAHAPVENVIVPKTDYTDPVATALQLAEVGVLDYSAEIRLCEDGREIVHRVSKTPQENFVIRVIKALKIPETVKAIMQGFKGGA